MNEHLQPPDRPSQEIRLLLVQTIAHANAFSEHYASFRWEGTDTQFGGSLSLGVNLSPGQQQETMDNLRDLINENLRAIGGLACTLDLTGEGEAPYTLASWHGYTEGKMVWSVSELPTQPLIHVDGKQLLSELRVIHSAG